MNAWLEDIGLLATFGIFTAAAVGVWRSGAALSRYADAIAGRTAMGRAFAGVLLLGVTTSLPEVATTSAAAIGGHPVLAGTNLLGGVAMQMAILALVDAFALRGKALSHFAANPSFLMQGVMLIALTVIACAAVAAGEPFAVLGVGFWSMLLGCGYLLALVLMYRYEQRPQWRPTEAQTGGPAAAHPAAADGTVRYGHLALRQIGLRFAVAGGVVLVSGYAVAESGAAIAARTGIGENIVGATLVAIATSLPEVSTTFAAVRLGAYSMAVGNILGTNALAIALFLPADALYRDGPIFAALDPADILLGALGILVTCIWLWGGLERKARTYLGMGIDSVVVVFVYAGGLALYYALAA